MIPQYPTQMMSENFHKPDEYHPERFLPESHHDYDPEFAQDDHSALQPFGFGPRKCIGMNLAYAEMRMILASLLLNFDLELDQSTVNNWTDQENYRIFFKPPLWVNLKPRTLSKMA